MIDNAQNNKDGRLSMRHSVMVWVAGAVLGWGVAVVSVYNALRSDDTIAEISEPENQGDILNEGERMEKIMPASGQAETPEKSSE